MDSTLPINPLSVCFKNSDLKAKKSFEFDPRTRNPQEKFENFQFIMIDFSHFIKQKRERDPKKTRYFQQESLFKTEEKINN